MQQQAQMAPAIPSFNPTPAAAPQFTPPTMPAPQAAPVVPNYNVLPPQMQQQFTPPTMPNSQAAPAMTHFNGVPSGYPNAAPAGNSYPYGFNGGQAPGTHNPTGV